MYISFKDILHFASTLGQVFANLIAGQGLLVPISNYQDKPQNCVYVFAFCGGLSILGL
jgi:hypothetical protein